MLTSKIVKIARSLGLDEEELFEMNLLDALLKIEDAKYFWRTLENNGQTPRQS